MSLLKVEILEICDKLKKGEINAFQTKEQFYFLFGGKAKPVYTGSVRVKDTGEGLIYAGHELSINGLRYAHFNDSDAYEYGSRFFELSLIGTDFEFRNGTRQTYTVLHESKLEILELETIG